MTKIRILVIESFCPFCKQYIPAVDKINIRLPPQSRIDVVNITFTPWDPRVKYLDIVQTPTLYIDGFVMFGATTEEFIYSWLEGYFQSTGELIF